MAAEPRREREDVATWRVLAVALGTLGFMLVSLAALWWFYGWMGGRQAAAAPPPPMAPDRAAPLRAFRAAQHEAVEGYGWVDREAGLVRVPVERAMGLVVQRGAAAYEPLP